MQEDGKERLPEQPMLEEERLAAAHHNAVVKEHQTRAYTGEETHDKAIECHPDVIHRDGNERPHLAVTAINSHWVTIGNVVERHVDIEVTEDDTAEVFVGQLRHHTHHHAHEEDDEGREQYAPLLIHRQRNLTRPERQQARPFLALVTVDVVVELRSQIVQVERDAALRIVALGKGKVARQVDIYVGQRVGRLAVDGAHSLLHDLPLVIVVMYESQFLHFMNCKNNKNLPTAQERRKEKNGSP